MWQFSVYRCHGNIDYLKKYVKPNFNLKPIPGEIFISICATKGLLKGQLKIVGMV